MKRKIFACNKLTRNKCLELFKEKGIQAKHKKIRGDEYLFALKKKLIEEAEEVLEAKNIQECIEELGDLQDVIDTLMQALSIDLKTFQELRNKKVKAFGAFDDGLYIESISAPVGSPQEANFSNHPSKYKDITNTA